jgi:hypothetical protein
MGRSLLSPSGSVGHGQGWGFRRVLPRVGAVAAIVGGSVMIVHEVWDARGEGLEVGVVSSALHTTSMTLLFVAFAGLGALQRSAFGRVGRVGTVLALAGSGGIAVLAVVETFSRAVSPEGLGDDPHVVFLVIIFASMGCYIVGGLLFAWATMRARVLPWSAGAALIVAMLLKMFASGLLPFTLALAGAAFIWLGISALTALRSQRSQRSGLSSESAAV